MRLYIIRHAEPDYPNKTITREGHLEAKALAVRMKKMGLDRIYCSPLGRAVHTMQYTAEALGMTSTNLPWTAEIDWARIDQDGMPQSVLWDVHGHTVRQHGEEITRANWHRVPPFDNPQFLEGFERIQKESDAFLAGLGYRNRGDVYEVEKGNRERVAIFCHGGFGLTWLAWLLQIPLPVMWAGFFLPPSSVTTVLFDERRKELAVPRVLGMGDVSHLYAAGLPVQPAGIKANVD